MKVSRNDPSPCGSGRKYKKCCLPGIEAQDSSYPRISQTYRNLTGKLMTFVEGTTSRWTRSRKQPKTRSSSDSNRYPRVGTR